MIHVGFSILPKLSSGGSTAIAVIDRGPKLGNDDNMYYREHICSE